MQISTSKYHSGFQQSFFAWKVLLPPSVPPLSVYTQIGRFEADIALILMSERCAQEAKRC